MFQAFSCSHPFTVAAAREIVRYTEEQLAHIVLDLGSKQTEVLANPAKYKASGPSHDFAIVVGSGHPLRLEPSPRFSLVIRGANDTGDMGSHSALKWHAENGDVFYAQTALPGLSTFFIDKREFMLQERDVTTCAVIRFEIVRSSALKYSARQAEVLDAYPGKSARARH
jgi:hypothetical protein